MQIDRKITKPIIESVPATELHYGCKEGFRLARGAGPGYSFGRMYAQGDQQPTFDVHVKGIGYDYIDDADGHSRDDSLACIEQVAGSGND